MNDRTGPGLGRGDEDLDDPAVAFGKLTDVIHKQTDTIQRLVDKVQVLTDTLLADRLQRQEELQAIGRRIQAIAAADPREDLGHVERELGALSKHVETLSRQPLLAKGPEHLETVITRASTREAQQSSAAQRAAAGAMEAATRDLEKVAKGARSRKRQKWWVGGAAGAALALGFLLFPLATTTLPGGNYLVPAANNRSGDWRVSFVMMEDTNSSGRSLPNTQVTLVDRDRNTLNVCLQVLKQDTNYPPTCSDYPKRPLIAR